MASLASLVVAWLGFLRFGSPGLAGLGGLGWPSEATIKDITALIAAEHWQQGAPEASVLFALVQDVKKLFLKLSASQIVTAL